MKVFYTKFLVLFFLSLSIIKCESHLISMYTKTNVMKADLISELGRISKDWKIVDKNIAKDYKYSNTTDQITRNITISNWKISSMESNFNNINGISLHDEYTIKIDGGEVFTFVLTFDYKFTDGTKTDNGKGQFNINTKEFGLSKFFYLKSTKKQIICWVNFQSILSNVKLTEGTLKDDTSVIASATSGISQYLAEGMSGLGNEIQMAVNGELKTYYDDWNQPRPWNPWLLEIGEKKKMKISINTAEVIEPKNLIFGQINYMSGKINENDSFKGIDEVNKLVKKQEENDKVIDPFEESDGDYQIFLKKELLSNIIDQIKSGFTWTITNDNKSDEITLDLNRKDLSIIIPGLLKNGDPTDKLQLFIRLDKQVSYSVEYMSYKTNLQFTFTIKKEGSTDESDELFLATFNGSSTLRLAMEADFNMNLVFDADKFHIDDISFDTKYKPVNEYLLEKLIMASMVMKGKWKLASAPVKMSNKFKTIVGMRYLDSGVVIIGNHN